MNIHPPLSRISSIAQPLSHRYVRRRSTTLGKWFSCALLLLLFQVCSGTDTTYATLVMLFVVLTGLTSVALGGPRNLIGLSCLVLAFQHVILSQIVKVLLWQPADAPLTRPITTMGIYVIGMAGILAATYFGKGFGLQRRSPIIALSLEPRSLFLSGIFIAALSILRYFAIIRLGIAESGATVTGGIIGPIRQLDFLPALSVVIGTAHIIVASNGKRSVGVLNVVAIASTFLFGFLGAGRASMALAVIPYIITCICFGFKFRWHHYAFLLLMVCIAQIVLFPYALLARRTVRTANFSANVANATELLKDIIADPEKYQAMTKVVPSKQSRRYLYYGDPIPTLDRYAVIIIADAIVDATVKKGNTEMETISPAFESVVPSFLNPNKTKVVTNNMLAHRVVGIVNDSDNETGITIGFFAESFSAYGIIGVFVISFLITLIFSSTYFLIAGSYSKMNLVYCAMVFSLTWTFSEASIQMMVANITIRPILLVAVLWAASKIPALAPK